ncbi:MAG: hypothetical protein ACKOBZ_08465 [Nitrospira sp.]
MPATSVTVGTTMLAVGAGTPSIFLSVIGTSAKDAADDATTDPGQRHHQSQQSARRA